MANKSDEKLIAGINLDLVEFNKLIDQGSKLAKVLKSNLKDLSQVSVGKDGLVGWNEQQEKTNKGLKTGKDLLREFYKEQRIQDRTTREATQAVIGFTIGLSMLVNNSDAVSQSVKRFTNSLLVGVTAMQGAEFSAHGLGIALSKQTGKLGEFSAWLQKNSGIIGVFVGVGSALIDFFMNVNKESSKAAEEGLKKFNEEFGKLGKPERNITTANIDARIKELRKERDKLITQADMDPENKSAKKGPVISDKNKYDDYTKRIEVLNKFRNQIDDQEKLEQELKTIEEEKDAVLAKSHSRIIEINKKLVEQQKIQENATNQKDRQKANDEIFKLSKEKEELLKSTQQKEEEASKKKAEQEKRLLSYADQRKKSAIEGRAKEYDENEKIVDQEVEKVRLEYDLNKISLDTAINQLQGLIAQTNETDKRLKIEGIIADLKNKDATQQLQRMNEQLDQASRIASLLQRAFSKSGDDFIAKLAQALQIAVNIAKIMNKNQGNNLGFGDYLEIGLNVASLFSGGVPMFAQGGELTRPQIRLAGEAGPEYYMPKKTFYDVARMEIIPRMLSMAKRDLVRSTTVINNNSTTTAVKLDVSELRYEIASLGDRITLIASAIDNLPAPMVEVRNPITLGEALKREMPVYEKFKSEKFIDS